MHSLSREDDEKAIILPAHQTPGGKNDGEDEEDDDRSSDDDNINNKKNSNKNNNKNKNNNSNNNNNNNNNKKKGPIDTNNNTNTNNNNNNGERNTSAIDYFENNAIISKQPTFGDKMWTCHICTFAENAYSSPVCMVCGAIPMRTRPSTTDVVDTASPNLSPLPAEIPMEEMSQDLVMRQDSNVEDIFEPDFFKQRTVRMFEQLENQLQKAVVEKKERDSALAATLKTRKETREKTRENEKKDTTGAEKTAKQNINQGHISVNSDSLSPHSPRRDDNKKPQSPSQSQAQTHAKAVSSSVFVVEDIKEGDHKKLSAQLSDIDSKEGLLSELEAMSQRVASKLAAHEEQVARSRKELMDTALRYREDKALWRKYAILDLQELCEVYYKAKMKYYHTVIDIEIKHAETCQAKFDKLNKSSLAISEHLSTWSIEDIRIAVERAIEVAYSIRLAPEVAEKKDDLKSIQVVYDEYSREYETLKQKLGGPHVDMVQRALEVTRYLSELLTTKRNFDNVSKQKRNPDRLAEMDEFVQTVLDNKRRLQIQAYILDERVKEGILCKKFIEKVSKNMQNIALEEIYEFIEGLIKHFCNDSFQISKIFSDKDITEIQLLIKVLIYTCLFTTVMSIRDAVRMCVTSDRGQQEYKQLKKVKKYAYLIAKVDACVGSVQFD